MLKKCLFMFKWMILIYVVLGFLVQFFIAFGIRTFQELVDKVVLSVSFNDVASYIVLYGALLAGAVIVNYLLEYPHTYLSNSILEKLKVMALSKVSKIDYSAYQNIGTGEMIKVIENGASAGMNIIHSFYLRILHELLPTIIFSLFFISLYNLNAMLIIAAGYVVIFFLNNLLLRMLYQIKSSLLESQEKMSKYSIRGFMELVVFRLNKRYEKEIRRLHNKADDIVKKSTQIRMIHESFFSIFALLVNIIKIFVLVYGVKSVLSGESSIGVIIALIMLIDQVYTPIAIFNVLYVDYKLNRVTYTRFEEFLNAPEDLNLEKGREVKSLNGNIEFKNVDFSYGDSRQLSNITFSVKQGSYIAIVGLSGSGKSTIIKLMLGLLKKKSGHVLYDGIDIDEIKLNSLYDHVSYISQEAPIFDTTIRENIVFDNEIADDQIYGILERVHLKEKVVSFPNRLDTMVGERGLKLSGGERQRLAFARIIAQQRNIVILDEPVSALDNITEKSIMNSMLKMFTGKTLIVIAHRLHFIKHVDKILLVKDGQIVDEGDFEYLINSSVYFQELWNRGVQNKSESNDC
ncbi:putative ABC transporter ATP-binding protein [Paenibacillus plantiphilus]|uniref:ABC transporter ATP-binding protein n=1 Tax=Paenibacillus plantiphilus TaxID=2905650 RepID=A0ABM9CLE8_9BACL|nr:ABC transporter ATP-binding protein [Paenibacillus plantiphilus]CAH1215707.1 putative ABC transporter ATP-binding protein [Paenibacillus plantiphilus]